MTETMLELVAAAIDRLDGDHDWVGIDKMRGYYVTSARSAIPKSVTVLSIVMRRNAKYAVCMNIVERLDDLDDSQWQRPWDVKGQS